MITTQNPVVDAAHESIDRLGEDLDQALGLLEAFCERYYWIKDHPDFQIMVRQFLTNMGRDPHPYGH